MQLGSLCPCLGRSRPPHLPQAWLQAIAARVWGGWHGGLSEGERQRECRFSRLSGPGTEVRVRAVVSGVGAAGGLEGPGDLGPHTQVWFLRSRYLGVLRRPITFGGNNLLVLLIAGQYALHPSPPSTCHRVTKMTERPPQCLGDVASLRTPGGWPTPHEEH